VFTVREEGMFHVSDLWRAKCPGEMSGRRRPGEIVHGEMYYTPANADSDADQTWYGRVAVWSS